VPTLLETIREVDSTYNPVERHRLIMKAQHLTHEFGGFAFIRFGAGNMLRHNRTQSFPAVDNPPAIWGSLREWEG